MVDLTKRKIEAFLFLVIVAFIIIYSNPVSKLERHGLISNPTFIYSPAGDVTFLFSETGRTSGTYGDKQCFVDDERAVGCIHGDSATVRDFEFIGQNDWQAYGSCKGWMSYWGCISVECNYLNGGVCSGTSSDSNDIECVQDEQCPGGYCGPDLKCITGEKAECSSLDNYKCESGTIYHCANNKWGLFGTCYETTKSDECEKSKTEDWHDLCKDVSCSEDSDCKFLGIFGNKICTSGECVVEEKPEIKFPSIQEWFQQNKTIGIIFIGLLMAGFFIWAFSEKKK